MLTRRGFLGRTAIGASAWAFSADSLRGADPAPRKRPPVKFIDVHTHVGTTWNGDEELTAKGLLEWMDAHDVERSIVLPLTSPESSGLLITTDSVLQATQPHRDRLIPFCSIDPRTSVRGDRKGFVEILANWARRGAKGFGEHKVGLDFDDPLMMRVYDACQEVGLPVLFHMDGIRGKDRPGLPRLERALHEFPGIPFIGHGPGWWASIAGDLKVVDGYPKGPVAPDGAIDRLFVKYPNLFGDLSAGSGANALSRDEKFGREFLHRRQDRLMFGTDYLRPGLAIPQFDVLAKFDLPADVFAKIARGNAIRVLKLPETIAAAK
jgi:predicted TIM-barrel fold metal-dependent hydrolase